MKFSIHGAAERELLDAAQYYRERGGPQLAESLVEEFERAYALLRAFPNIGARWRSTARLLPIERFPYSLVYYMRSDEVRIIAFAHQKRKQGFWRRRR
ncbi:MAG: type II toxin-antitoxin system RelE/ParE family toxin [Burkholderiaceae bacterium]|nr:type II toxin-antitoxin system RelE/ParE family toxin [Burkholderiaceae bacterium]